ncbi:nucleotidyltransferase domain-containing protein [Candidatus Poribacteria bacterium]|nr:nucleotidyltransferase domain-containing protein [Candidatus Poribacteria bacterium]
MKVKSQTNRSNSDNNLRHQEAFAAAERCAEILRKRFGAERVILFGSLVGDSPWHGASDLDLAVEGLSLEALWKAEGALEEIVPPWLTLDLVPLERAYPEIRKRILERKQMPEEQKLALKSRLGEELAVLERINSGLADALGRTGENLDEFATRALASYVEDFYTGCERICERVAVTLDGGLPTGEHWHRELLRQMGEPGGSGRPALFGQDLSSDIDEYRRFRHRVRHIYGYELEANRVVTLARQAVPLLVRLQEAVETFCRWLEAQTAKEQINDCTPKKQEG